MTSKFDPARLQPTLIAVALAAAALAALVLLVSGRITSQQAGLREQAAALASLAQNIPLQAGAAVRGSAPAFDALAESRAQLDRLVHGHRGIPLLPESPAGHAEVDPRPGVRLALLQRTPT